MKKVFLFAILIITVLTFIGCGDKNTPQPNEEKEDITSGSLVMFYLCGSDLESGHGEATKTIDDLLLADASEDTVFLIMTGGASSWTNSRISSCFTYFVEIKNKRLTVLDTVALKNMGSAATLSEFVNYAVLKYPNYEKSLIFWDHGGGSAKGVCYDENFNLDFLTLKEIDIGLSNSSLKERFKFIGFDACLMGGLETAVVAQKYTDRLIASEELEPGGGWDYKTLSEKINEKDFDKYILNSYAKKYTEKNYYTLSSVDLTRLSELLECLYVLINTIQHAGQRALINALDVVNEFGSIGTDLYDFGNLLSAFDLKAIPDGIITSVNGSKRADSTGLSLYFPFSTNGNAEIYFDNNILTEYINLINDFFEERDKNVISFLYYAYEIDNKLAFSITMDSLQYLAKVEYKLYRMLNDEINMTQTIYAYGTDNDVITNSNEVVISFNGRWVEIGGQLLYCEIKDKKENDIIYQSPIMLNGETAELLFSYNGKTTEVIGVISNSEDRIYDLQIGDVIKPIIQEITVDNSLKTVISETAIIYDSQTKVKIVNLPDGYYQYTAYLTDVYGKDYTAGTAVVKIEDGVLDIIVITSDEIKYPQ